MKGFVYVASLVLSLPNLVAGMALLIWRHTFATRNPLRIVFDFLFQIVWGVPLAVSLFLLLLILGCFAVTRAHAALFAFVLNAVALGFVVSRIGLPPDFETALVFLPALLALIGFGWLGYRVVVPQTTTNGHE